MQGGRDDHSRARGKMVAAWASFGSRYKGNRSHAQLQDIATQGVFRLRGDAGHAHADLGAGTVLVFVRARARTLRIRFPSWVEER
jgi:hypothetical protein